MEQKKPTKSEMERRMKNAIVLVPRDKDSKTLYFDDKGLRVTFTQDYAVIATGAHQHVFNAITASGVSRPYLYTKRFIEIALDNDCKVKDEKGNVSYSYSKLFETLQAKEDKSEFNVCSFVDWWLFNIFTPLFSIGESETEQFMVYENYLRNIAKNYVILSEKTEDMTQRQFIEKVNELEKSFTDGLEESVLFKSLTDEERMQEEMKALQEQEMESNIVKLNEVENG